MHRLRSKHGVWLLTVLMLGITACSAGSTVHLDGDEGANQGPTRKKIISASSHPMPLDSDITTQNFSYHCGFFSRCDLDDFVKRVRVCALMVLKASKVVFTYPNPSHPDMGFCGGNNGPARRYGIASVTKSITSTLLGFALDDPTLPSERRIKLADLVTEHLPELAQANSEGGYDGVSVDEVLRMRSGVAFDENGEDGLRLRDEVISGNVPSLEFAKRFAPAPGQLGAFHYAGLDTQVLGILIEQSTGQKLYDYLRAKLWEPLGMEDPVDWKIDVSETAAAFCCFEASLRDLAKFGNFVLRKGNWNGQQLLSSAYLTEATRFDEHVVSPSDAYPLGYRYQWWTFKEGNGEATARGRGGQFIHLIPAENLVIVQISQWDRWRNQWECETYDAHRAIADAVRE